MHHDQLEWMQQQCERCSCCYSSHSEKIRIRFQKRTQRGKNYGFNQSCSFITLSLSLPLSFSPPYISPPPPRPWSPPPLSNSTFFSPTFPWLPFYCILCLSLPCALSPSIVLSGALQILPVILLSSLFSVAISPPALCSSDFPLKFFRSCSRRATSRE